LRKQQFQFQRIELLFERRHNNEEWRRLKPSEDSKLVRNIFVFCIIKNLFSAKELNMNE
jgi:hypothetical protein